MGGTSVQEEIIKKIVLPNARSFCRLRGSDHSGREFISGDTRTGFQEDFQKSLAEACDSHGVEIIQALITKINPPQQIAQPVRDRQIAVEKRKQFGRQLLQQESEKQLAIEQQMNERKQALVEAQKQVIKLTTEATQAQEIALIEAQKRLKVAELELQAATDQAAATLARGTAAAKVVEFQNEAEAAGWKKAVAAFGGSGDEYARWTMLRKLAPAYRSMMINTADSPIMDIFKQFEKSTEASLPSQSK
jgi:regulator of protease activity HflC (stomatin/prohibitin superfamily)